MKNRNWIGGVFQCPYYMRNDAEKIRCEAGDLYLSGKDGMKTYAHRYCMMNWKKCTLARVMGEWYDEQEEI